MQRKERTPDFHGWQRWWPFILLCAVRASRWMFSEALPGSGSTVATEAFGCASAAALCLWIGGRRVRIPGHRRHLLLACIGGALFIAGPLLTVIFPVSVSGASVVMALALTPVVLAVIDASAGQTGEALAGRLWPGLAALAALLLLLAEPSLASPGADLLLLAIPVATGCGAALFCAAGQSPSRMPLSLLGASGTFALSMVGRTAWGQGVSWPGLHGLATGLDALEAFLCVLALHRISTARWSAQFAIVPLLVLLEGVALLHSAVVPRIVIGLLLLAVASIALLVPPSEEPCLGLGVPRREPRRTD